MAFIKGGKIEEGVERAVKATVEIKRVGVLRFLDRIYLANKYLEALERKIGTVRRPLQEVMHETAIVDY